MEKADGIHYWVFTKNAFKNESDNASKNESENVPKQPQHFCQHVAEML